MQLGINGRFYVAPATGVQRVAREISARLPGQANVTVFLPASDVPPAGLPEGAQVARGKLRGHLWEQVELPRSAARCDVVLHLVNTCPLAGRTNVVMVHDVLPLSNPEWFSRPYAFWHHTVVRRAVRTAAHVIVASRWSADQVVHLAGVEETRVTVVAQGAAPFDAPASEEVMRDVRARWDLPDRFLLMVGGGDPRKNVPFLYGVLDGLRDSLGELPLVVVGGESRVVHGTRASESVIPDSVRVLGRVSDQELHGLYTAASLLLFPSLGEGFGRPPLEAGGCGTPSVIAPYGPAEEVMGSGAAIVPLEQAAWTDTIRTLLGDQERREALAERAFTVSRGYRWSDAARQVLEVCEAVASDAADGSEAS